MLRHILYHMHHSIFHISEILWKKGLTFTFHRDIIIKLNVWDSVKTLINIDNAAVLELADRHVWGACVLDVRVQVPFAAPNQNLVNTAFARFFHAKNPGLDFILDLIGEKDIGGSPVYRAPADFCLGVIWVLASFFPLNDLRHDIACSAFALRKVMTVSRHRSHRRAVT